MITVGFMVVVQITLIFKGSNFLRGSVKVTKMVEVYHGTNILLGHCLYDTFVVNHSFCHMEILNYQIQKLSFTSRNDKSDSLATGGY